MERFSESMEDPAVQQENGESLESGAATGETGIQAPEAQLPFGKPEEVRHPRAEKVPDRRETRRRQAAESSAREKRLAMEQADLTAESSLRSAIREGTPFTGTAVGVEILEGKDGEQEAALAVLPERRFKAVIPFSELFTYNPIDMSTVDRTTESGRKDYVRRKRVFAEKMIGSRLTFCLTDVRHGERTVTALASRAAAMRQMSRRMFGGPDPRVKEGDTGRAVITAVSRHAAAVEFCGVDAVIPQYRLTLRWMRFVSDVYAIGDSLDVSVREIRRDGEGNVERLTLDPIACELADARERCELLRDGTRLRGIVTNVYRPAGSQHIFIYAWLPGWEIPARISRISANEFGREIRAGTELRLEVTGRDENGYVTCVALSEHGNSAMFTHWGIRGEAR